MDEGLQNRFARFRRHAEMIRKKMDVLGVKAAIPKEHQSNTLTAFYLPDHMTYLELHDELKKRGYVIYAGQGPLESKIFRVANIGALTDQDIDGFLGAFQEVLKEKSGCV